MKKQAKRLANKQLPPKAKISVQVEAAIPHKGIIATNAIKEQLDELQGVRGLLKLMEEEKARIEKIIKDFMGENEKLITSKGKLLATYIKYADGTKLDEAALKLNFADVWAICQTVRPGVRRFEVKA